MRLSPYRVGVAGPWHTRLLTSPAFRPCCCSLALSGLGKAVASESSALNSGLLRRQFAPCVTWRTVSLHPAQASQRPSHGPVPCHTTCWVRDTTETSRPSRGREHQGHGASAICNAFYIDSSLVLVPRHRREVCPLARRVILPRSGATRIPPITGRPSLFPTPLPAPPSVGLAASLPRVEEHYGLITFRKIDTDGLGALCSPGALAVHDRVLSRLCTRSSAFWLKPSSILGLSLITTFIESSHVFTIPSIQPHLRLMLADTPSPHGSGVSRVTVGTVSAGSVR